MSAIVDAPVTGRSRIGVYWVLTLEAPEIAARAEPGQFVTIGTEPVGLLRRPFSIYRVEGERVSIAFDAVGPATRWLASCPVGAELSVVGPLGRGFDLSGQGDAIVVGGGYGTAALVFIAERLRATGSPRAVHAIAGARTADRLFLDHELGMRFASLTVTTDDGSAGRAGVVTDVLPGLVASSGAEIVYACGPNRMLDAVARTCATEGVRANLAFEEFMACGIGVCWTCVRAVKTPEGIRNLRVCTEGPVFDGAALPDGAAAAPEAAVGGAAG
ncbi:MAG TPA: dihydroorotate dehydrogenase electron transfer subunit [Actinomycetota bacterium]